MKAHSIAWSRGRALLPGWLMATVGGGCAPDLVAPGYYAASDDSGEEASPPPPPSPSPEAASPDAPQAAPASEGEGDASTPGSPGPCDLSGRWLVTDREVATGLGSQEATHTFFYMEIGQSGSSVTVTKGLDCGGNIRNISAVGADVDYPKVWPAVLTHDTQTGRTATSVATSTGCNVSFEKRYLVMGATVPYYDDPGEALPTTSEQAAGSSPGWEDWDQDGNPGFTLNVTGLAVGQLYMATRTWNAWSGAIAAHASTFKLADQWNTEQSLLGYQGSSLLTAATSGSPDNDASLHFVQFARLAASQATGDDAAVCSSVRSLAGTVTPDASN
jgi:hypothetical protein